MIPAPWLVGPNEPVVKGDLNGRITRSFDAAISGLSEFTKKVRGCALI